MSAGVLLFAGFAAANAQSRASISSPHDAVKVTVSSEPFAWSVEFHGSPVITDSPLGLEFQGEAPLGAMRLVFRSERAVDETWHPVWGRGSTIHNVYRELTLHLEETRSPRRRLDVTVRAFDGGVGLRYVVPEQPGMRSLMLAREDTGFRLPGGSTVWAASYENFRSAYESEYTKRALTAISQNELLGLPLLAQAGASTWVAITEAELTDWAGMYLKRAGDTLTATLSPRRDKDVLVETKLPARSPWRVLMLARTPAELLDEHLIGNLTRRNQLHDTSWIKPGITAWDHWWSGDVEMTAAADKRYIDFASYMHFPYQLVDWQWYGPFNKPQADLTRPVPQIELPALLRYAAQKHVRLWLWIHSGDVDRALAAGTLEKTFATYERWGIAGVKIDFMESDDQQRVHWYEQIAAMAAAHHLMVDFHGAYKPTGLSNAYPNVLTIEGVLGNEYNKFSKRDTPLHKATLPFTRGLVGPMDYTPGGFLNVSPAEFKIQTPTEVMGSRANELALFVVYWSPLTCVSDDPAHYIENGHEAAGLEFLRGMPTVWDETRGLDGAVGEHVIVARRKGRDWWLGGIAGNNAYGTVVPLKFLGPGRFRAHIYADPTDAHAPYTAVEESTREVTAKDSLTVKMRAAGGVAVRFERVR